MHSIITHPWIGNGKIRFQQQRWLAAAANRVRDVNTESTYMMKARPAISCMLQSNKAQSIWQQGPIVNCGFLLKGLAQWKSPVKEQPCPQALAHSSLCCFFPLCFVAEISSLGGNSSAWLKCFKLPYLAYILFCLHISSSGHRNVSLQAMADSR